MAGLMALGLGLRLAFVFAGQDNPHHHEPIMDSAVHVEWARAIAAGESYAPLADRPFFRAPLYVWFLAGVFFLFGDGLLAPRLVQCGLGAASVGLTWAVARRAFGARAALVAGLLAATYWVLIYFDGELLIPTLAVPLDLLALWLTLGLARPGHPARAAPAGLAWGVAAIARPNVLLLMPLLAGWLLWMRRPDWRRGLATAAVLTASVLTPILPITAWNTFAQGDFVLISSQGGVNFWIGNHPDADGVVAIVPGTRSGWWDGYLDAIAQAEAAEGRPLRASEVSRHYAGRAWEFIGNRPGEAARLWLEKLRLFWTAWEYANNEDIHFFAHRYSWVPRLSIGFGALAGLGLLGFGLCLRSPGLFPLSGFLVVYCLSVVAFFVNARYRVPMLPVLMVFAGHAVGWLWGHADAKRWGRVALGLGFAAAFGAWSTLQAPRDGVHSNGWVQLALAEARRGNTEVVIAHLHHALALDPDHVTALVKLGWAERMRRRPEAALPHFRRAVRLAPLRTDAVEGLLGTLVTHGRLAEAETWIAEYLAMLSRRNLEPSEIPYYHRGRLHAARGELRLAAEALREALRRDPRSTRARRALAEVTGEPEAGTTDR